MIEAPRAAGYEYFLGNHLDFFCFGFERCMGAIGLVASVRRMIIVLSVVFRSTNLHGVYRLKRMLEKDFKSLQE